MRSTRYSILLFALILVSPACLKVKNYPDTPQIKVTSASLTSQGTVKAVIEFTDGDGDIGLGEDETNPPYDTLSKYYNNLLVSYYVDTDGVWNKWVDFGYRIKPITPEGKIKVLEGEIQIDLFIDTITSRHKAKYGFVLVDRALHESNYAESGAIQLGN